MKSVMIETKQVDEPAVSVGKLVILDKSKYLEGTSGYVVLVTHVNTSSGQFKGVIMNSENDKFKVGKVQESLIIDSFKRFSGTITLEQ